MNKIKYFFLFGIIFFTLFFSIIAGSHEALAYSGSADWEGGSSLLQNMTPNPAIIFNIPAGDEALYKKIDLRLDVCQHSQGIIYFDDKSIASLTGPGGPGGCGINQVWADFDLGTLSSGSHSFFCQAVSTDGTGTSASCVISQKPKCTFSASLATVASGGSVDLIWTAADASSTSIDKGVGTVTPALGGTKSITPTTSGSITYTMTANGIISGTATCSATINVTAPSCTLTASPNGVFSGETAQLKWQIIGAASSANVTIDNGVGSSLASPSGTADTPAITGTTPFTLSFAGLDSATHSCSTSIGLATPPAGGLIPCGRLGNLPPAEGETDLIDESQPCSLCAMFYLLKKIINFITALSAGIGVFILIIAGLLYALSAGNPRNIELAKSAVTSVLIGLAIIFTAWLAIAVILQGMGYAGIGAWYQVSCPLPTPTPPI